MLPSNYIFFFQIENYVDALGTALEDGKFRTGEYIILVHDLFSELKALLYALYLRLDLQSYECLFI